MVFSQHEGVVAATKFVLGSEFIDGEDIKSYITKEQRQEVVARVAEMFTIGDLEFKDAAKEKHNTPQKIKTYACGLVTNWFNKSKALNGGEKYTIKNPGVRKNKDNAQLQPLLTLKQQLIDTNQGEDVIAVVDAQIASLSPKVEELPSDLSEMLRDIGVA